MNRAPRTTSTHLAAIVTMAVEVAALLGDRELGLRDALTRRWIASLFLIGLLATAFAPAALLHKATHELAFGAPEALVWAVMAFDSLVVGLLAALVGSALQVGHAAAPGLRGWRRNPCEMA